MKSRIPLGIEIHAIAHQSETVKEATRGFGLNLVESVAIVVVLLVLFMGLREGFIIGMVLLMTTMWGFGFVRQDFMPDVDRLRQPQVRGGLRGQGPEPLSHEAVSGIAGVVFVRDAVLQRRQGQQEGRRGERLETQ